jgi:hypothetical protein
MCLGETLLPWKFKDKKCCLYKMPYVPAPIWVLGDIIAKFYPLRATSYRCTYKSQIFFGSRVTRFWRDTSCHFETPTWNFYKEIYEQKWYWKGLLIALLEDSCKEYLQASLQADSALAHCHEKKSLRNPEEQEDHKKGMLSDQPRLTCVTPTELLGSGVLQPIEGMTFLGTDFEKCTKCQGPVEEPTAKHFVAREVRTIELTKVQGTSWNAIKCKERLRSRPEAVVRQATINLYSRVWKSLGVSFPKLYCADLVEAYVMQESVSLRIYVRRKGTTCNPPMDAWETFSKRRNRERTPVQILVPDSHEHLASRKCIMCTWNMGAHV